MIAGVYLAAGRSERFGSGKLLRLVGGKPLFSYGLEQCVASKLGEIRVVVGPDTSAIESEIELRFGPEARIRIAYNDNAGSGMMSSVKTGLRGISRRYDAAMVLLADMPLVTAIIIDALIETFEARKSIVVPECAGEPRHPRIIPRDLFGEFLALADDEKGTKVLEKYKSDIIRLAVGTELNYIDIDKPEDLKAFENL
jgi:CTP:molybdopterin cytidylyltransferase MocA